MSLGFFEQSVVRGHQIVASCGLGGGNVEGIEAGDARAFDPGPASHGFHDRNVDARVSGHGKGVGAFDGIGVSDQFQVQIVAGDDCEAAAGIPPRSTRRLPPPTGHESARDRRTGG